MGEEGGFSDDLPKYMNQGGALMPRGAMVPRFAGEVLGREFQGVARLFDRGGFV